SVGPSAQRDLSRPQLSHREPSRRYEENVRAPFSQTRTRVRIIFQALRSYPYPFLYCSDELNSFSNAIPQSVINGAATESSDWDILLRRVRTLKRYLDTIDAAEV